MLLVALSYRDRPSSTFLDRGFASNHPWKGQILLQDLACFLELISGQGLVGWLLYSFAGGGERVFTKFGKDRSGALAPPLLRRTWRRYWPRYQEEMLWKRTCKSRWIIADEDMRIPSWFVTLVFRAVGRREARDWKFANQHEAKLWWVLNVRQY